MKPASNTKLKTKIFIIGDNNYALCIKKEIENFVGDQNESEIFYYNSNRNYEQDFLEQLFKANQKEEKIYLIVNSESYSNKSKNRSELYGSLLLNKILTSMTLDFKGHVILYGFLPENVLYEKLISKGLSYIKELKYYNCEYLLLPFSKETLRDKLIVFNKKNKTKLE